MAGLLPEAKVPGFFELLEQAPQDLIGLQHQRLMMHCFKESHSKLPLKKQTSIESSLYDWLKLELTLTEVNENYLLAAQAAYPEGLLLRQLEQEVLSTNEKKKMAQLLGGRLTLSEAGVAGLIRLAADEGSTVRDSTASALKKKPLWYYYKLIAKEPALTQALYASQLIPANYQQAIPFYSDNNQLYFYSDSALQSIELDQPEAFQSAILAAQQAVGIPHLSQIKTMHRSPVSSPASSSSDTFFDPPIPGAWPIAHKAYSLNP